MVTKPASWFAADIVVPFSAVNAAEAVFDLLDSEGVETDLLRKGESDQVRVTGIFEKMPDRTVIESVTQEIFDLYEQTAEFKIEIREIFPEDWLAEWKRHWHPTESGRFLITPPWIEPDKNSDKIVIKIEPNMAFGTGTHETTRLCLKAISDLGVKGDGFLDVGTGTGILSIAAARLTNIDSRIYACDTDAESIAIARENARINGVEGKITFEVGELRPDLPKFGTVVANVTLDVILPILELLIEKAESRLILSGILKTQEREIMGAIAACGNFAHDVRTNGEWIAVILDV